jgi:hypothetical protein
MKRSHLVQMMYPEGSIVRFLGDDWLDSLQGCAGLVVEHDVFGSHGDSMRILVNGKMIDIVYDEFEDFEMEIIQ